MTSSIEANSPAMHKFLESQTNAGFRETMQRLLGVKTVLLVDDEPLVLEILNTNLSGWVVHQAHSAEEAIEILGMYEFDLIISDLNMPGKDGLFLHEFVQALNTPTLFILHTSDDRNEELAALKSAGELSVWKKPIPAKWMYVEIMRLFLWHTAT